jgi:hypothetical protein
MFLSPLHNHAFTHPDAAPKKQPKRIVPTLISSDPNAPIVPVLATQSQPQNTAETSIAETASPTKRKGSGPIDRVS